MTSLFELAGRKAGRALMKGRCLFQSLTGTEAEAREAEKIIGRNLAEEMLRKYPRLEDDTISANLNGIGERLRTALADKSLRFRFYGVHASEANAFALPGGFIFVTAPILRLCFPGEDRLAYLLAHEMGHVVHRHSAERLLADSVFTTLSRTVSRKNIAGAWISRTGAKLLTRAYSRDEELDADDFAARLTIATGFDPIAGAKLLQELEAAKGPDRKPAAIRYFATHPPLEERLEQIRRSAGEAGSQ